MCIAGVLFALACSGQSDPSRDGGELDGGSRDGRLTLTLPLQNLDLPRNGSVTVPLTVVTAAGSTAPVEVTLVGPSSLSASALQLPAEGGTGALLLHAGPDAPLGSLTVSVSAVAGAVTQSVSLPLRISLSDYLLSVSPPSMETNPGVGGNAQVSLGGPYDFGAVGLSCSGAMLGVRCTLSQTYVPGPEGGTWETPVQVAVDPGTPDETVRLMIEAQPLVDGGLAHSTPLDVTVRERDRWITQIPGGSGVATALELTPWNTLMIASNGLSTLTELDRSGNILNGRNLATPPGSTVSAFTWSPDGALYVAGHGFNGGYAFLDKFGADGGTQWQVVLDGGAGSITYGNDVTLDDAGNAYLVGWTSGAVAGKANAGGDDGFAASFALDGGQNWALQFGTATNDFVESAQPAEGGLLLMGHHAGLPSDPRFLHYLNLDGGFVREDSLLAAAFDGGTTTSWRMHLNPDHTVWIAGFTNGDPFGQGSLGQPDGVIARYALDGTLLQAHQLQGSWDDELYGLAVDPQGSVFVSGVAGNNPAVWRIEGP